jgi:hypothetical protein
MLSLCHLTPRPARRPHHPRDPRQRIHRTMGGPKITAKTSTTGATDEAPMRDVQSSGHAPRQALLGPVRRARGRGHAQVHPSGSRDGPARLPGAGAPRAAIAASRTALAPVPGVPAAVQSPSLTSDAMRPRGVPAETERGLRAGAHEAAEHCPCAPDVRALRQGVHHRPAGRPVLQARVQDDGLPQAEDSA